MLKKILSNNEIYKILKERIIQLEYDPGEILNENDIANEFELSRTPVRKIFEQLKTSKLLNIIPRYGAQVAPIDFNYMKSIFEVVREIEAYATGLAAERMTDSDLEALDYIIDRLTGYSIEEDYKQIILDDGNFHKIIFDSCDNPCLSDILHNLHMHTERLWFYVQKNITEKHLFIDTLTNILNALKARDSEMAVHYAKEHTDMFVEKIKEKLL
ncbi:MAG: GntR family transcriptional regulator [Desulfitibacter sp. BRH_c19]|nr:MAG: GntR family transcriptional regulator [Desulfitibacter sp. BRH_c19]